MRPYTELTLVNIETKGRLECRLHRVTGAVSYTEYSGSRNEGLVRRECYLGTLAQRRLHVLSIQSPEIIEWLGVGETRRTIAQRSLWFQVE